MHISMGNPAGKRALAIACALACLLSGMASPAHAAKQEISDFCKPILEYWGATTEKELQQAILTYWEENQPKEWRSLHKGAKTPVSFWFGGTTNELIENHKKWDVAIVSSKDVDLQKLADAGVIRCDTHCGAPNARMAFYQWPYPESVQQKLPEHPLFYHYVYCYSYDEQTDEAIFLLCNEKHRPMRWHDHWAKQILETRNIDQIRAAEGFYRIWDWESYAMPELSATEEDLAANPDEWDWAILRIGQEDKLEKLDAAGLLYDFSQDEYWVSRNPQWESWDEPSAIWSNDNRIIAIPYHKYFSDNPENKIFVFVVNEKSPAPVRSRALEYSKHFIKSIEWGDFGKYEHKSDWKEIRKYEKKYNSESYWMILKKDVHW